MKTYDAPNNLVEKIAHLTLQPETILGTPDKITTLHDLALDAPQGRILIVSWFYDQAIDFTSIQLKGMLMKNGYYTVTLNDNMSTTYARAHGSCIVLFWQESAIAH
jgi:hypothetical protein